MTRDEFGFPTAQHLDLDPFSEFKQFKMFSKNFGISLNSNFCGCNEKKPALNAKEGDGDEGSARGMG